MKEIEDKIMEHKDELMATSKKKKKKSKLEEAAAKAAGGEDAEPGDIVEVEGDGEFNSLEEGESGHQRRGRLRGIRSGIR